MVVPQHRVSRVSLGDSLLLCVACLKLAIWWSSLAIYGCRAAALAGCMEYLAVDLVDCHVKRPVSSDELDREWPFRVPTHSTVRRRLTTVGETGIATPVLCGICDH